jgi:LacI family transcriptional regulator
MDRSLANLPVVALAIHGAESAITSAGGTLLFADVPTLAELPKSLARNRVDGVILKGALQGDAIGSSRALDTLRRLPSVWLLGRPASTWGDCIAADDFRIGKLAAEHLIAPGHRRIAFLNPKPNHVNFARREASFVWHAEQSPGVRVQRFVSAPQTRWELPLRPAQDVACVQELVDALLAAKDRPTAVFTPGDSIAALVYRALAARGLKAGQDLSVMSANNEQSITQLLHPSLTTIDVHAEQIGRRAVDQLTWRLSNRNEPNIEITIEPELIPGDSVAQPGDSQP